MKDKDLEILKLEVERLKIIEGFLRTLAIIILTTGAGIGTLMHWLDVSKDWIMYILSLLVIVFLVFGIIFVNVLIKLNVELRKVKEQWNF